MNEAAEEAYRKKIHEVAYNAFLDLRETLKPKYGFKDLGYDSVEHARLVIIQQADRVILKLSAEHLKKYPV